MTTYDPEDQAERRRGAGRCRNPFQSAEGGGGAQNLARPPSTTPTRKIFAVFQTGPDGLDDARMISRKDGCNGGSRCGR